MAKFLSPDSRSDWNLGHTQRERFVLHTAWLSLLYKALLGDTAVSLRISLWEINTTCSRVKYIVKYMSVVICSCTHVALLKPTYSFPASLFMKFITWGAQRQWILHYWPFVKHFYYMLLIRRFYPKRLTYSILWAIPTGAIWGEVSQGHNDMLTAVGFEPVLPWSQHQRTLHCATRLFNNDDQNARLLTQKPQSYSHNQTSQRCLPLAETQTDSGYYIFLLKLHLKTHQTATNSDPSHDTSTKLQQDASLVFLNHHQWNHREN